MRRWNWGFLPILLLWLLICNEFIQAQRQPAPRAPASDTQSADAVPATTPAPATRPHEP